MICNIKKMRGYKLRAVDGEIGKVHEFLFNDRIWRIDYLVARVGRWPDERLILIPRNDLKRTDRKRKEVSVNLTVERVKKCPGISADEPVSRRKEMGVLNYLKLPDLWAAHRPHTIGKRTPVKKPVTEELQSIKERLSAEAHGNPDLRSSRDVIGYRVRCADAEIGDVEDLLVEDESWEIKYMIVKRGGLFSGGVDILIASADIGGIEWEESNVFVKLPAEEVESKSRLDKVNLMEGMK